MKTLLISSLVLFSLITIFALMGRKKAKKQKEIMRQAQESLPYLARKAVNEYKKKHGRAPTEAEKILHLIH